MTIILGIIKLLGSAGFGTIFGGLMGILNRKVDLQAKRLDMEESTAQRNHELAMRDKDAAIMREEYAAKSKIAQIEGETAIEREAYTALGKSYEFAKPAKGGKMEAFSAFVRPFISLGYWVITSAGSAWILYHAFVVRGITLTPEQWFELVMYIIAWIAFMGGATIGWWYAMRPGKQPPALSLR